MKLTFTLVLLALFVVSGCGRTSHAAKTNRASGSSVQWSQELFAFSVENLNHLEDNDCQELMQSMQMRLIALTQPQIAPEAVPANPLLASWPEPDMLRQVVGRLNQWVDTLAKSGSSTRDKMLRELPAGLAKLPMVAEMDDSHFSSYDGYALMEAVWARDVARWAKGNTSDELLTARNLFDWTVRNIQLDYDRPDRAPQVPWETLFLGHGDALERAWTYILLLRQCGIDAAVLALPAKDAAATSASDKLKPWCVAVLLGDKEKKLYLFDPLLGLPIPAAGGISAGKAGQLQVVPATLDQIARDPKNLDRLALASDQPYWVKKADLKHVVALVEASPFARDPKNLDRLALAADQPYWVKKADLKHVVALVEASPLYLEPRAKRIEASLAGDRKLVLGAKPSQQAARLKAAGVGDVRLWELPYATLQRRMAMTPSETADILDHYLRFVGLGGGSLYKGRILHLKGRFFDEKGAIAYYQRARPRTRTIDLESANREEPTFKAFKAQAVAAGRHVSDEQLKRAARLAVEMDARAVKLGKIDAAYWLGLIQYELGQEKYDQAAQKDAGADSDLARTLYQDASAQYDSAIDYFIGRTLQAGGDTVFWAAGAHYNIARCQEMSGQWDKAVVEYESNLLLRNDDGCLLRARWLREVHGTKPPKEEKEPVETKVQPQQPEKKGREVSAQGKTAEEKVDQKATDQKKGTKITP